MYVFKTHVVKEQIRLLLLFIETKPLKFIISPFNVSGCHNRLILFYFVTKRAKIEILDVIYFFSAYWKDV